KMTKKFLHKSLYTNLNWNCLIYICDTLSLMIILIFLIIFVLATISGFAVSYGVTLATAALYFVLDNILVGSRSYQLIVPFVVSGILYSIILFFFSLQYRYEIMLHKPLPHISFKRLTTAFAIVTLLLIGTDLLLLTR